MRVDPADWGLFVLLVFVMLAVDLFTARRDRASTLREAAIWSALWIGIGLGFGVWIFVEHGRELAVQYYAAYLLEKALSVDNIFVFLLIFSELRIPAQYQHRVLSLGILSALVMRALMIGLGVYLIQRYHWVIYPFAVLLLIAAGRLLFGEQREREIIRESCDACDSWVARLIRVTPDMAGGRFFTKSDGRRAATPLFVGLLVIETTDLVFALDSIPAVLAITREPFLVYSSNVFAMLGLRSLYFLLGEAVERMRFLRPALAFILAFVALKMLLEHIIHIDVVVSLIFIAVVLAGMVVLSLLHPHPAPTPTRNGAR